MAIWKDRNQEDQFSFFGIKDNDKNPTCYVSPTSEECSSTKDFAEEFGTKSWAPLQREQFIDMFDCDGRLVDEHKLRQAVFRGGLDQSIRKEAWKFLFGFFSFHSTKREREVLLIEYYIHYKALRDKAKKELNIVDPNELCVVQEHAERYSTDLSVPDVNNGQLDHILSSFIKTASKETQQQIKCMELLAQIDVERQSVKRENFIESVRMINKDVPRTDRDHPYFRGGNNPHLNTLKDILITFSLCHPTVGYSQGMNDILSRFLIVLDAEVEAYWCFTKYIESTVDDYSETGMMSKLDLLSELLQKMDSILYSYIISFDIGSLTFCHRWLLVGFKREFTYEEGLRLFEILSSHYLEINSLEAEKAKENGRKIDFEKEGGKIRLVDECCSELTFDLFVCVALLLCHRKEILQCQDMLSMFKLLNSIAGKTKVEVVLQKAEQLFFEYCKKSVVDCFLVL